MKRIKYLLLACLLFIPFCVKAEETFIEFESDNYKVWINCEDNVFVGLQEKQCDVLYGALEGHTVQINVSSDYLLLSPSGSKWAENTAVTTTNVESLEIDDLEFESFKVKNVNTVTRDYNTNISIKILSDATTTEPKTIPFIVKPPVASANNGSSSNQTTTTASSTKSSSEGIVNPNTKDENVLMLSIISILLLFIIGISIKRFKTIKR